MPSGNPQGLNIGHQISMLILSSYLLPSEETSHDWKAGYQHPCCLSLLQSFPRARLWWVCGTKPLTCMSIVALPACTSPHDCQCSRSLGMYLTQCNQDTVAKDLMVQTRREADMRLAAVKSFVLCFREFSQKKSQPIRHPDSPLWCHRGWLPIWHQGQLAIQDALHGSM